MDSTKLKFRLGKNARAIRQAHGLTLEDVAKEVRGELGKSWKGNYLADIETGRGGSTIEQVVTLAIALSEASGRPVSVHDLIQGPGLIEITPWVHITPERLAEILSGGDARLKPEDRQNALEGASREFAAIFGDMPGFTIDESQWTLADDRARKKLDLDKETFKTVSLKLWGNLLSVESEKRAGENASAQKKGIITRQLMREIQEEINRDA